MIVCSTADIPDTGMRWFVHPNGERVLQQLWSILEYGADGKQIGLRREWRDVPVVAS